MLPHFLGPCGAGTLASRAGGLRPPWVAFGHMAAPCGRRGAFGSYRWPSATCDPPISQTVIVSDPVQVSQICDGKSPLSQPALIMSNPVQISQICDGKWPAEEIWTGSDTIRVSQICDGKWLAEGGFSVTNLGNLDKIRHDQGFPNSSRKMAC